MFTIASRCFGGGKLLFLVRRRGRVLNISADI